MLTIKQKDMIIKLALFATVIFSVLLSSTSCNKDDHEDEEDGTQYGISETYNMLRNGVRLILSYSSETSFFEGTIENTTESTIRDVRVEVHLSNGTGLGSTPNIDLASGETFNTWSADAEVGEGDDDHGEEGDGD